MAKIYVGCALTDAPTTFANQVEELKALLREEGHEVADFVGTVKGTASEVYETDIHKCVANSDIFIAVCDYPSIGLGWEIGTAVEKHGKPVLAVAHRNDKVTRMLSGAVSDRNPLYRFFRYSTMADIVVAVSKFLFELEIKIRA